MDMRRIDTRAARKRRWLTAMLDEADKAVSEVQFLPWSRGPLREKRKAGARARVLDE
ncbi:MAG: hypothetical protein KDK10_14105 [Maritimibacter sp.]|nr:hypothetical protein [Maritimibacter sp.]